MHGHCHYDLVPAAEEGRMIAEDGRMRTSGGARTCPELDAPDDEAFSEAEPRLERLPDSFFEELLSLGVAADGAATEAVEDFLAGGVVGLVSFGAASDDPEDFLAEGAASDTSEDFFVLGGWMIEDFLLIEDSAELGLDELGFVTVSGSPLGTFVSGRSADFGSACTSGNLMRPAAAKR